MKNKLFFLLVLGVVSYLIFLIGVSSIGANPITLNYDLPLKNELHRLAPQGWAFFTKDVRKDFFSLYKKTEGYDNYEKVTIKSSSQDQIYGLKRDNRSIMHKISYLIKNIDNNLWYEYKGNLNDISIDSLSTVSIEVSRPMIFGEFLISKGEQIPYEWSRSKLKVNSKSNYIILNLKEVKYAEPIE